MNIGYEMHKAIHELARRPRQSVVDFCKEMDMSWDEAINLAQRGIFLMEEDHVAGCVWVSITGTGLTYAANNPE